MKTPSSSLPSDNGPWLPFKNNGGSAGLLRGGKGTTWEGGMRSPCIFYGPGLLKNGLVSGLGSTMDLFTTFSSLAGVELSDDRIIDGVDLSGTLLRGEASPREKILYYRGTELFAARYLSHKAHFIIQGAYGELGPRVDLDYPHLYNLDHDPSEKFDVAEENPEIVKEINSLVEKHNAALIRGKDQLADRQR